MTSNQLIGIGYETTTKGQFWWLTIYKSMNGDFDNIMHFINDYYEERKVSQPDRQVSR